MTIRQQGKNLEKKVVRGSKTVGRDVKMGISRAGRKLRGGATTVGRDVRRAGSRVRTASRSGADRVERRLGARRRARAAKP
jgi:hypothetical protein